MQIDDLETALLDLLHKIQGTDIKLIIGGGYGIYLKIKHARSSGIRTLLSEWPEARSTNDLDLFLRPELLIQSEKLKPLSVALKNLGYEFIETAKKYQFYKPGKGGGQAGSIKIDLLTGPESSFKGTMVNTKDHRRARPNPSVNIHAHITNEAVTLEDGIKTIIINGYLSSGIPWEAEIFLPHLFTLLMMKLFAFRDRYKDENKEYGSYHALDIYSILAASTDEEWNQAIAIRDTNSQEPYIIEAGKLVNEYFFSTNRFGIIRLKESPYYRPELQIGDFISALQELFPLK